MNRKVESKQLNSNFKMSEKLKRKSFR